jgi:hypothetical protein
MPKYVFYSINVVLVIALGIRAVTKNFFSNTFEVEKLVSILLISGLILALLWSRWYLKKNNITDSIERTQTVLIAVIGAIGFFVAMGINLNYLVSLENTKEEVVEISKIDPFIKVRGGIIKGEKITPSGYHVFIKRAEKEERLRYDELPNYETYIGKKATMFFRKGLLGFDVCIPKPLKNENFQ